jgi:uncharacterized protein (DUF488 family)
VIQSASVYGIGYEGRNLADVLAELDAMRTDVLVDIRLNPVSRKRGLSKTALSEALSSAGIEYLHLKALGNPRENRAGYAQSTGQEADAARATFAERLTTDEAQAALSSLTELARTKRVAVLCYEASELNCHRRDVLNAVRARLG